MSTSTQSNRKDGGPAALPGYPIEVSRCRIAANFPLKKGILAYDDQESLAAGLYLSPADDCAELWQRIFYCPATTV
jgi:hypothetical protein